MSATRNLGRSMRWTGEDTHELWGIHNLALGVGEGGNPRGKMAGDLKEQCHRVTF